MMTRRTMIAASALAMTGLGGGAGLAFRRDMRAARERIAGYRSRLVDTRWGRLEYAESGQGFPLLMIHGSGGGCDQGQMFAAPLAHAGYRVVAPSRFGYLRSAFPGDPSSDNQADAFADMLDTLGIERVAVIGASAGALSALAFAIRHPGRCAALIAVVPAAYTPNRPPARPWTATQSAIAEAALRSDFLFWSALRLMPDTLVGSILATDPALLADAPAAERRRVTELLYSILPVSARADGLINDMRLAGDPAPMALDTITAPTLAVSLADDRYLTADAARHIAATVPGARLVVYPSGGHVFVNREMELFTDIRSFLAGPVASRHDTNRQFSETNKIAADLSKGT